jgi:hypothetical protein
MLLALAFWVGSKIGRSVSVMTSASSLRRKAFEVRRAALAASNEAFRRELTGIAEQFDRLAVRLDSGPTRRFLRSGSPTHAQQA